MNKETIYEAVDSFIDACVREQTACAEAILEGVDALPDDKEQATAQVMEAIKQAGIADNLTRCLGAGALEDLAREVVFQYNLTHKKGE